MIHWSPVFNELLTLRIPGAVLFLLLFTSTPVWGQAPQNNLAPVTQKSTLAIFVLPTSHQKIETLKQEIAVASGRSLRRLAKLLIREQTEIDSFSRSLQEAVEGNFTFTEYIFLSDTILADWLTKAPVDQKYCIIRKAKTESGADALVMYDRDGKRLARPVPYYAKIFRFSSLIDAFLGQANYAWKDLDKVLARWSERLQRFYAVSINHEPTS